MVENMLGDGDSDCSNKGAGIFWGPIRGKIRTILINLKKYSSHEPLARMHCYLAWNIFGARRFRLVQMKSLESCMAPSQGLKHLHSDIQGSA